MNNRYYTGRVAGEPSLVAVGGVTLAAGFLELIRPEMKPELLPVLMTPEMQAQWLSLSTGTRVTGEYDLQSVRDPHSKEFVLRLLLRSIDKYDGLSDDRVYLEVQAKVMALFRKTNKPDVLVLGYQDKANDMHVIKAFASPKHADVIATISNGDRVNLTCFLHAGKARVQDTITATVLKLSKVKE